MPDVDPRPQDPCVVAAVDKFTRTTEILWRKKDGMATLQVREGERARESPGEPYPCLYRLLLLFWVLHQGWSSFTMRRFDVGDYLLQTTKERMLLITSKRKMLQIKGKSG